VGARAALMVDAGASAAHAAQFCAALREHTASPLRFAALTHWHWDHVFGLAGLGLPAFAHHETRRRIQAMAALDWRDAALAERVAAGRELPFIADHVKVELSDSQRAGLVIAAPEITFADGVEVDLGGLTVCVRHVGGDHSPDCSVIYSPEERVAFLGDCFGSGYLLRGGGFLTLARLLPLLDTLDALPVDHYVLGHDAAPITRAQFLHDSRVLRITGEVTVRLGEQAAALAHLPQALGEPLNDYSAEDVASFLTGLHMEGLEVF
jgi:glyoxylase-like metal-dependent hydrolase (beta-lactamase superfamily II)